MSLTTLWPWTTATRKRQPRPGIASGLCSETLELRQMLSAVNTLGDEAVALATESTTVDYELTFSDDSTTVATVTTDGKKASVSLDLDGFGDVTLKGKIKSDNSIAFKGKLKTELGKVKLYANIAPAEMTDIAGDFQAILKKEIVAEDTFTGDVIIAAPLAAPVVSEWDLEFSDETDAGATITLKGKKITVETGISELGDLTLKGKQSKEDPNTYFLKGSKKTELGKATVNAVLTFDSETELSGNFEVSFKKEVFGEGSFTGDAVMAAPLAASVATEFDLVFADESEADALFTTSGKKLTIEGEIPLVGGITLKGKQSKDDPTTYNLKGKVKTELGKVAISSSVTYTTETTVDGTYAASLKKELVAEGSFEGEAVIA